MAKRYLGTRWLQRRCGPSPPTRRGGNLDARGAAATAPWLTSQMITLTSQAEVGPPMRGKLCVLLAAAILAVAQPMSFSSLAIPPLSAKRFSGDEEVMPRGWQRWGHILEHVRQCEMSPKLFERASSLGQPVLRGDARGLMRMR
ncbi:unnamed protein product [Prorocentrum cordatum]|uniref:Uncharacterized protein n=1 Tax=Prorocentrum cordatum TaxID=2364126 RepID=A0ABN9XMG7_9DINO|nr:unnamed protein product [Polarella glacialis]